jgi:ABC-type dipeptide/oligopeptide/nickel transport system ATPase component
MNWQFHGLRPAVDGKYPVASIGHRVAVIQRGEIVKCRRTSDIFRDRAHPYARQLVQGLPTVPRFAVAVAGARAAGVHERGD